MRDQLAIRSSLEHDGDGLVRFHISVENVEFRATTLAWGYEENVRELVSALKGFPKTGSDRVEFTLGSPRSGLCRLEFLTIDSVGHCCVWIDLEAPYSTAGKDRFQRSLVCIQFAPGSLDEFCTQLRAFKRGQDNEAVLIERAL